MVLASDLKDASGRLLLPGGTVLDPGHLGLFAKLGVAEVEVGEGGEAFEDDFAANLDPEALERAKAYVMRFFEFTNLGNPFVAEVFAVSTAITARRIMEGFQPPEGLGNFGAGAEIPPYPDLFFKGEGTPEDLVKSRVELASFPDIYFRIMDVLGSATASAAAVAAVVEKDAGLSAKLLKLVNSPFYGFPSKIDSISRAVALIGTDELTSLALGISAIQVFRDIPPELMDMRDYWRCSVSSGVAARLLAAEAGGLAMDRFFVAGLLATIGRLVILHKLPFAATQAILYSASNGVPMFEAEREVLGFDHSRVGYLLLKEWKFPEPLWELVRYQHSPLEASQPREAAVLAAAQVMAAGLEVSQGRKVVVPGLDNEVSELLDVSAEAVAPIMVRAAREIEEIISAFLG